MATTTSRPAASFLLAPALMLLVPALMLLASCAAPGRSEVLGPRIEPAPPAPRITWSMDAGRGIEVTPFLGPDGLYVATTDRRIQLVDLAAGRRLWRTRLDGSLAGLPTVAGNHLLAVTEGPDGSVYAVDLLQHRVRWRHRVGDPAGSAAFFEGTVLAATRDGSVFGLSPADGRPIWATSLEARLWCATGFDSARAVVLAPSRSGDLFAVDARSGEKRWVSKLEGALAGVASGGGRVAAVSIDGHLFLLDAVNGQVIWSRALGVPVSAPPLLTPDLVVVVSLDGTVSATRLTDGSESWRRWLGGPFRAAPAADGARLAVAAASGQVWLLETASGRILGAVRHPETVLVSPVATPSGWVIAGERGHVLLYRWEIIS